MERPSLHSMDSSSFEDEVFGKQTYKGSPCKQGFRDSSMSVFFKQAVERRRSAFSSIDSSSFEDSFNAGIQISPMDYIKQLKAKEQLKKEKTKKLLQMHNAMSLEEKSETIDTSEKPNESLQDKNKSDIDDTETVTKSGKQSDMKGNKRTETMTTADHSPTKKLKTK